MYPLLLHSPSKTEVWGGKKIFDAIPLKEYASASELFLLSGDGSAVKNGELKEYSVTETVKKYGKRFFGEKYNEKLGFPFKIRLIDAKEALPIGVSTRERLYYVCEAEENARMIYGLSADSDSYEITKRISSNLLIPACNLVPVKKGDIISVPAGTLHAIGKGTFCFEIALGDESFYPVSDYGRTDGDGRRLSLKTDAAVRNMTFQKSPNIAARLDDTFLYPFGTISEFTLENGISSSIVRLSGSMGIKEDESFVSAVIAGGTAAMSYPSGTINLKFGDSVLIPAKVNAKFTGYADIICTHI